ncbi:MAG: winged helix-turn-helix domain-containing protein [Janthinobacterium lividum]
MRTSEKRGAGADHRIGSWLFERGDNVLRRDGEVRALEDRAARVLDVLCRRRGAIVTKAELLDEVWQGRAVSPNSVAVVIGDLRRALGDTAGEPRLIVTVAKRGYRLADQASPSDEPAVSPTRRRSIVLGACACAAALLASLSDYRMQSRLDPPVRLEVEPVHNDTGVASYDVLARSLSAVIVDRAARFPQATMSTASAGLPDPAGRRVVLRADLIMWNGRPEVAITATDARDRTVIWSGFATGATGALARSVASRLDGLGARLRRATAS